MTPALNYVISGLPLEAFEPLFGLDDEALVADHARRATAGETGRYPCRVTLEDAKPGERLLLINYQHQDAATPYLSNHAISVSEPATATRRLIGELLSALRARPIALRAFNAAGMMVGAELILNDDVERA